LDEAESSAGAWQTALSLNVIDTVSPIAGNEFIFTTGWRLRSIRLTE
jgi:hypothetical protein